MVVCLGEKKYRAGDIIEYMGGGRDYLVAIEGEEGFLYVNACDPSEIERGLCRFFDDFLSLGDFENFKVVGHWGDGGYDDARRWYAENKESYQLCPLVHNAMPGVELEEELGEWWIPEIL